MINDDTTAVATTEAIKVIQKHAEEKIAYNSMYNEAKEIKKTSDDEEMNLYYDAVKDQFYKA